MSEKEVFIGMAIGDGFVNHGGSLRLRHSIAQIGYYNHKKQMLIDNGFKLCKEFIHEPSGYGVNKQIEVSTSCTFIGKGVRVYLYPNGKKIIPDDLIITPKMWALIYQDDGRQNKSTHYSKNIDGEKSIIYVNPWVNRYTIYTDSFDLHSVDNLIKSLMSYGIESRISYSNKNKLPHIHISKKESKQLFKDLILPYIAESMLYKLNLPVSII